MSDLKAVCVKHKIKYAGKNKGLLIAHILKVLNPVEQTKFSQVLSLVTTTQFTSNSLVHHKKYKEVFNAIDLYDRCVFCILGT